MSYKQLHQLYQEYLDGSLSEADLEHLNQILRSDAEARVQFIELMDQDLALAALVANDGISSGLTREVQITSYHRQKPGYKRTIGLVSLCAAVLLGIGIYLTLPEKQFASIVSATGVKSHSESTQLGNRWHQIDSGVLELKTATGAHLVLEAPAHFRFHTAQKLELEYGRLAADVPASATKFTVVTPTGNAVDIGTKFGVDVPLEGESQIHVFEGEVIAESSDGGLRKNLFDGDAFQLQAGGGHPRNLRSAAFIRPDEVTSLHAAIKAGKPTQSGEALDRLRNDPSLIALLNFESDENPPGRYSIVQGRWPGSRAPEFINIGDHMQLNVAEGQTFNQLTLAAWVRLDRFGDLYQSLLHTDGWSNPQAFGQIHWMVTEKRQMRLALFGNDMADPKLRGTWEADSATSIPDSPRRWTHLAVVYDSDQKQMRFYLDGKFDNVVLQEPAYPARLGPAQIGNWNIDDRKLSGRIDELLIWGRDLSEQEISDLFEAGNPYQ
ncbi:LamG-like jellyroll fold domain-containing protein [Planctomicrobium sp. SH668]|uniref:LamG-like jellyroll fold domain-containing protein n=1 Tax=Planctomicrobium sp. SH668 TaxID=3448126 RepID=UPI003F5C2F08